METSSKNLLRSVPSFHLNINLESDNPSKTNYLSVSTTSRRANRRSYGGPQLSHQIQIAHIKYKLLTSNTRLNGQRSENENYVQFSLGLDPTAIFFLHMVLSSGCFAATAEEMSTIATFVATAGKVS